MKNKKTLFIALAVVIVLIFVIYLMFSNKNSDLKLSCETYIDDLQTSVKINVYEKKDGLIYDIIDTYDVSGFTDEEKEAYQELLKYGLRSFDEITGIKYNVKIKKDKLECTISIDPSVIEITEIAPLIMQLDDSGDTLNDFDDLSTMTVAQMQSMLESGGFECKKH